MSWDPRKIVWYEGMILDPHHLQQWDRHHEHALLGRLRALRPYHWGFQALEIDEDRLANGELALRTARGLFPDGLYFDAPTADPLPPPRPLQEHFASNQTTLAAYLAIPASRPNDANYLLNGAAERRDTRFHVDAITVRDETTGGDERTVEVAKPNLSIRFAGEPLESYTTIRLAEVVRTSAGTFALQPGFVPPSLSLGASQTLLAETTRTLERLASKHSELATRWQNVAAQRELSPSDISVLNLLTTIAEFVPLVRHFEAHAEAHPESLFLTLSALAGRLTASTPRPPVTVRQFPVYDHSALTESFGPLFAIVRQLLGEATPDSNYVRLPLVQEEEGRFRADIDETLLRTGRFYLVAQSEHLPGGRLRQDLPVMLRVASPSNIQMVLRSFTPALPVEVAHQLPPGLPVNAEASYFRLKKSGPFWDAIARDGALSLFVPFEFRGLSLQLLVLRSAPNAS
ncbi:MAG: type VI secretion system baseplate subunit TssK [Bacteroidota bacterium]